MTRRTAAHGAALALVLGLVAACSGVGPDRPEIGPPDAAPATSPPSEVNGELVLLAASSLTEVFDEIIDRFEETHPDVTVLPSYMASSSILAQLDAGTAADVIATADEASMARLVAGDHVTELDLFATNMLAIAVEPNNPAAIRSLADLARDDIAVGACVSEAPCGRLADAVLVEAGIEVDFVSREPNVKAAVSKVAFGELDAALVYVTDVAAADVDGVSIPSGILNRYPVTVGASAPNPVAADAFVEFLSSDEASQILRDFGFGSA